MIKKINYKQADFIAGGCHCMCYTDRMDVAHTDFLAKIPTLHDIEDFIELVNLAKAGLYRVRSIEQKLGPEQCRIDCQQEHFFDGMCIDSANVMLDYNKAMFRKLNRDS